MLLIAPFFELVKLSFPPPWLKAEMQHHKAKVDHHVNEAHNHANEHNQHAAKLNENGQDHHHIVINRLVVLALTLYILLRAPLQVSCFASGCIKLRVRTDEVLEVEVFTLSLFRIAAPTHTHGCSCILLPLICKAALILLETCFTCSSPNPSASNLLFFLND